MLNAFTTIFNDKITWSPFKSHTMTLVTYKNTYHSSLYNQCSWLHWKGGHPPLGEPTGRKVMHGDCHGCGAVGYECLCCKMQWGLPRGSVLPSRKHTLLTSYPPPYHHQPAGTCLWYSICINLIKFQCLQQFEKCHTELFSHCLKVEEFFTTLYMHFHKIIHCFPYPWLTQRMPQPHMHRWMRVIDGLPHRYWGAAAWGQGDYPHYSDPASSQPQSCSTQIKLPFAITKTNRTKHTIKSMIICTLCTVLGSSDIVKIARRNIRKKEVTCGSRWFRFAQIPLVLAASAPPGHPCDASTNWPGQRKEATLAFDTQNLWENCMSS